MTRSNRRLRAVIGVLSVALSLSQVELNAQELEPVLGGYQLDAWRSRDGVRLSFASNLVQTSDGYLWLSTQSGLVRFDGVRFQLFDGSNTPALFGRANLLTYPLLEDREHRLWIGSDRGLLAYHNGRFDSARQDSTFATDLVNDAVVDSTGQLWVVTRLGRLFRVNNDGSLRALPGARARALGGSLAADTHGDLWIAAGADGVYRVHKDSVSAAPFPADVRLGDVNRIYAAPDGSLWMGFASSIAQWKDGRIRQFALPAYRGLGAVTKIVAGPEGELWVGTDGRGLYRFDGKQFTHFTRADGLSDDRVIDILIDQARNIWVATRDGLNRLRPTPFDMYTSRSGLPTDLPGAMLRDRSDTIWLAPPTGGLFKGTIDGTRVSFATAEAVSVSDRVTALAVGMHGHVWVGHRSGSVTGFETGRAAATVAAVGLPPVTDIVEDADGTLWIGTWHGLYRWRHGILRTFGVKDGLPDDAIHRLRRDALGALWVATQSGIARASGLEEHFAAVTVPNNGTARATVLFEAPKGTLWVGSTEGLARVSGGPAALVTTAQGLPDNWVGAGEVDGSGYLWLGQLSGVTRVRLSDLVTVADGRATTLTGVATYPSLDGLPGGDPTAWPHPWSFRDQQGRLWFAMGHGIAMIDPARMKPDTHRPHVIVEQVLIDGHDVPFDSTVVLQPSAQRMQVRFTGVDLTNGPAVRFRYRMDGFDTTWVDAGTQRTAGFTRLQPGNYRLHISARAVSGDWSTEVATADFRVLAPLYKRAWFLASVGFATLLLLWSAHRAALIARSRVIRDERARLAREVHDSLLQGFGGIALQLHAASVKLDVSPEERAPLDRILRLIDRTLAQARETVWDIRSQDDFVEDMSVAFISAAERIFVGSSTTFRVHQRGPIRRVPPTVRTACLRIVEEALSNALKHADATEVVVELHYSWRRLRLAITDNGQGGTFHLDEPRPGHWGLLGMRERASQIGGTLALESSPGRGTRVSLDVGIAFSLIT